MEEEAGSDGSGHFSVEAEAKISIASASTYEGRMEGEKKLFCYPLEMRE